jgi:hypothetical protein
LHDRDSLRQEQALAALRQLPLPTAGGARGARSAVQAKDSEN